MEKGKNMIKDDLVMTEEVEEHVENYYRAREALEYFKSMLREDFLNYLKLITEDESEIAQVIEALEGYEDLIKLMDYLTNGDDKTIKDIVRQAYVISDTEIPFERITQKFKPAITREERKELDNLNIPYPINSLYKAKRENEHEYLYQMTAADFLSLTKIAKKQKDPKIKKLVKKFEDEFASTVPIEEVKEIHLYYPDYSEEIIFLDEEGLHQVVGKKARVRFLDGRKKVGYLGCDFKDVEGDECVSLFESYSERKGFYNYNTYKTKEILKMDVLFYPREEIDFKFHIKVRDIKKYTKGVTEKNGK